MCGIFGLFNWTHFTQEALNALLQGFLRGKGRGPDNMMFDVTTVKQAILGFHRLSINGLDAKSNQPMCIDDCVLLCNGEIYNWRNLLQLTGAKAETNSDCESIIHCYRKYGIEKTLNLLDGVFAFVLYDQRLKKLFVARDPYGVRPMFLFRGVGGTPFFGIASELKMATHVTNKTLRNVIDPRTIRQFPPGSYYVFSRFNGHETGALTLQELVKYSSPYSFCGNVILQEDIALQSIRQSLESAVNKRVENTDRPIACLLSGGLDSSLICALVNKVYKGLQSENGDESGKMRPLETYSIGLEGSDDLRYARMVAEHLGTKHREIVVTEQDMLSKIPNVVYTIESYDTTTVRASVGNYSVCEVIAKESDAKVIFNGDGSDEVCGGYMYFHCAPDAESFDYECKRLLNEIASFDVLRSDRSISYHGLEARTPFLDRSFVHTFLSISKDLRWNTTKTHCEKYLLRKAFDETDLLPKAVLWRTKEAFSDGVSKQTKSWYQIIQDHVDSMHHKSMAFAIDGSIEQNHPQTDEQLWYRAMFRKHFPECDHVIPHFWMPSFVEGATDASARTLDIYREKQKKEGENVNNVVCEVENENE